MKILVEVLQRKTGLKGLEYFEVVKEQTLDYGQVRKENIDLAKSKVTDLRKSLDSNYKIRVTEFHNDEPDKDRKPCKILYEE